MSLCLGINDDIVLTFDRYEIFKKNQKPFPFVSVFLGEYSFCNILNETVKNNSNSNLIKDDFSSNFNDNFIQNNNNNNQSNNSNHGNIKSDINDINDIFWI